jgi:hypothetical protein
MSRCKGGCDTLARPAPRLVKVMVLGHTGRTGEVAEWLKAAVC